MQAFGMAKRFKDCLLAGSCACALAFCASAAENSADPPKKDPTPAPVEKDAPASVSDREKVAELLKQVASDDWQTRESATKALCKADASALPQLEEALKAATDPEVKERLSRAVMMVKEIPIEGGYTQEGKETWVDGEPIVAGNDHAEGTLSIADGKAVWVQSYDGREIKQTYAIEQEKNPKVKAELTVEITWKKLEPDGGYSPDKNNTKLVFEKSAGKLRVVLHYEDTQGHRSKVTFVKTGP